MTGTLTADGAAAPPRLIRIGPAEPVDSFRWLRGDGPPFIAVAGGGAGEIRVTGLGVDVDQDTAARAAICEVLERQAAYRMPRADVWYGTAAELPGQVAEPCRELTAAGWWVRCEELPAGRDRLLPLEYVQFATPVRRPLTGHRGDSTGMAVHRTDGLARRSAEAEIAERAQRHRLVGAPAPRYWCTGTLPGPGQVYLRELQTHGCDVMLVPAPGRWSGCVALVTGRHRDGAERMVGGSAAAAQPRRAAERALAEAYAKAYCAGIAGDAPDGVDCAAAAGAPARSWLRHWTAGAVPVPVPDGESWSGADGDTPRYLVDRGDDYTDAVGLRCVQIVAPGQPTGFPAELVRDGLGAELFG